MRLSFPVVLVVVAIVVTGCGGVTSGSSGAGSSSGTATVGISANQLSFAATTVGQTSASQMVTVTNTGSATLTLNSAVLSDNIDYAVMTTCGASLAVSASCTLTVEFKPQSSVSLPATITISDSAENSPQVVSLSGMGTNAPLPQATLSPNTGISFTAIPAGTTSSAQTVTLANAGTGPLTIANIAIGGTNPAVFAETNTCSSTLSAGSFCSIYVTISPASASTTYSATLTVTDNAGNVSGATQTVALGGAGAATSTGPIASLSPSLTFAATNVGASPSAQAVTLANIGTATLTGITVSITGTAATSYSETTTCGTALMAGNSCSIAVTFTPTTSGTLTATLSVSDNATGSPQTVTLTGTGNTAIATFTSSFISFPATAVNTTSTSQSVTLTNTGNITLNIASILLGGTNMTNFAVSTTCGATLLAGANCSISATFTPSTQTSYSAKITVTDSAVGSPQLIALSGSGSSSNVSYTLYTFPESDNSVTPLYTLVNAAQSTIDMTMYELQDTTFTGDLTAACARGVRVRVVLSSSESSSNATAFNALNSAGSNCSAVQSNTAFTNTHQKTITVDGTKTAIMSLNLQTQYYSTTRDFAMVENDATDIAAIEATFAADYAAGKPSGGTQGASDFSYQPGAGDDLIWSPTTAQADMLGLINNATTSIVLENEEMSASNIVSALVSACQRGVTVHIAMVENSSYDSNFTSLKNAGCGVNLYPDTTNGFYVHAKAVVADYGLSTQRVYMGSINYSTTSMNNNRELGMHITDPASVLSLYNTLTADYAGGTPY